MARVTIIAELGSSPYPAWDFAPWCAAAANAGADAVKVQLFRVDVIYPEHMRSAMRPREFPRGRLAEFVRAAHAYGLTAGASVFDTDAVALAAEWCDWLKLAASQQANTELIDSCLMTGKRVYRSIADVEQYIPLRCWTLFAIPEYPASGPLSVYKLWKWVSYCKQVNNQRYGWSSHTTGTLDCVLAARLGASVVEKHFDLDGRGVESGHSLQPAQFAQMVRSIRKGQ